jgi:putative aldouronate transport system permease protein
VPQPIGRFRLLARRVKRYRVVYLLLLPGLIYFAIFRYWPLYLAQIAFKDFQPLLGVEASPWNGLANFMLFFKSYYFTQLLTNTLIISVGKLIFGIPPAIILAIALYEARHFPRIARLTQTTAYLPHFLSWVVVLGVLIGLFSPGEGLIIDTWVFREGILNFQFGLAAAVGLFKGVVGLCLIFTANRVAKRFAGTGLY